MLQLHEYAVCNAFITETVVSAPF